MYYLQSRYYNPDWGRFINADGTAGKAGQLLSHNMFAYCLNNPVNMSDPSGFMPTWAKWALGAVAVVAVVAVAIIALPEEIVAAASTVVATAGAAALSRAQSVVQRAGPAVSRASQAATRTAKGAWDMTRGGANIGGREFSEHALERMAPNTLQVRAELTQRAIEKGLEPGTKAFQNYLNPRGIPPMVVEDIIQNGTRIPGNTPFTWQVLGQDANVVINEFGDVITVFPK